MLSQSIYYEVPGMHLIRQDKNMACWYASVMMLLDWGKRHGRHGAATHVDDQSIQLYKANNGVQNFQIIPLARRLGLVPVPPMSPTIEALYDWLRHYGPLWTNGVRHIVVIAGIRGDSKRGYEVKVYDPWPGNGVTWRSLAGWYTGFDQTGNPSSRDVGKDVEAVFLRLP